MQVAEFENDVDGWSDGLRGALASSLGQSGGQFSRFSTMTPTGCTRLRHARAAVEAVNGWDTSFITSQDSDLVDAPAQSRLFAVSSSSSFEDAQTQHPLHSGGEWDTDTAFGAPKYCSSTHVVPARILPVLGAVVTLALFLIGSPFWNVPPMAYGLVLLLSGTLLPAPERVPLRSLASRFASFFFTPVFPRVDGRLGQKRSVFQRPCLNTRSQ